MSSGLEALVSSGREVCADEKKRLKFTSAFLNGAAGMRGRSAAVYKRRKNIQAVG